MQARKYAIINQLSDEELDGEGLLRAAQEKFISEHPDLAISSIVASSDEDSAVEAASAAAGRPCGAAASCGAEVINPVIKDDAIDIVALSSDSAANISLTGVDYTVTNRDGE